MSPTETDSPLDRLPPPGAIHQHMGRLYRQLALLRRLLRLSQAAHEERARQPADRRKGAARA
ncbi:MAG TPA: hypothetical protein VFW33_19830 [Gemmataceae bacterium]|nr:hypothetical protein [Gemmataceae bacterium]